jgi:putative membrane protein
MAFLLIVAISTVYELLEWITAEIVTSDNAYAFLGTQGDPFDSQKDTALALAGALLAIAIITLLKSRGTR